MTLALQAYAKLSFSEVRFPPLPPLQSDLRLDDTVPFRLSRNHFMIVKREDETKLQSTLVLLLGLGLAAGFVATPAVT